MDAQPLPGNLYPMKISLRDLLTLVGSLFTPLGAVFVLATKDTVMWWVGMSLVAIGPVLVGVRAILKDNPSQ